MHVRLHVGLPKCASTWLQRALPATGTAFGVPHWVPAPEADPILSAVADLLSGDAIVPARHRGLLGRLAEHEEVLVSSELMAVGAFRHPQLLPTEARLDRILHLTGGADDVSALVFVRRDGERLLHSLYSEYVKNGGTRPRAAFVRTVANPELADPGGIATRVRAAIPRTTVLHLEDLVASPQEFVNDLGTWLGRAIDPELAGRRENVSMTGLRLSAARTVNRISPGFGERGIGPSRPRWLATLLTLARARVVRRLAESTPSVR